MSQISQLNISTFRNLLSASLELSPSCNVFFGLNGSGKTSLLEAIYFLGLGRSFRTRQCNHLIQHEQEKFTLFGLLKQEQRQIPIGIERLQTGKTQIKLDNDNVKSIAVLAQLLPVQLIHPDGHQLLTGGPKPRRQFIDWGVFHVEPSFLTHWQRAQRAIKHRNILLKQSNVDTTQIEAWNKELVGVSTEIDQSRKKYLTAFTPIFNEILAIFLPNFYIEINYLRGWDENNDLNSSLERQFRRDQILGYTQSGPHRADLSLTYMNHSLTDILSQGQQKLVNYALRLAQGKLLHQQTSKQSIYLVDDLPAELDIEKRALVADVLHSIQAQTFITGIDHGLLQPTIEKLDASSFHVKHGVIEQAIR